MKTRLTLGALAAAGFTACGGGGDDTATTTTPAPTETQTRLVGVAATGAPLAGAAIKVCDATGASVSQPKARLFHDRQRRPMSCRPAVPGDCSSSVDGGVVDDNELPLHVGTHLLSGKVFECGRKQPTRIVAAHDHCDADMSRPPLERAQKNRGQSARRYHRLCVAEMGSDLFTRVSVSRGLTPRDPVAPNNAPVTAQNWIPNCVLKTGPERQRAAIATWTHNRIVARSCRLPTVISTASR